MRISLAAIVLLLVSIANANSIEKRETISKSTGMAAQNEFNAMNPNRVFSHYFTNAFGKSLGESRTYYFDKVELENNGDSGLVSEKIQNCWHTLNTHFECETVYQERKWTVQDP